MLILQSRRATGEGATGEEGYRGSCEAESEPTLVVMSRSGSAAQVNPK